MSAIHDRFLFDLVSLGGRLIEQAQDELFEVSDKGQGDPVTELDKAVQKAMLVFLRRFPYYNLGVFAEEDGYDVFPGVSSSIVAFDPMDGTKNFLTQRERGLYACQAALIESGLVTQSAVYYPRWKQALVSGKGIPDEFKEILALLRSERPQTDLSLAVGYNPRLSGQGIAGGFPALQERYLKPLVPGTNYHGEPKPCGEGSACGNLLALLAGKYDAYINLGAGEAYDLAPIAAVADQLGFIACNVNGNVFRVVDRAPWLVLARTSKVLDEILRRWHPSMT